MKGGAVDFLTKPVDEAVLLGAIRQAVARTQADRRQLARLMEVQSRIKTLTPREAGVFALVVTGMLNKQEMAIGDAKGGGKTDAETHAFTVAADFPRQALHAAEIKKLEEEGDALYHEAVGALFSGKPDPIEVIRWKEVYESLEIAIDQCMGVANAVHSISIKNS